MKRSILTCFAFVWSCANPPVEPTRPFIAVTLEAPSGFEAPEVDTLEISSLGTVDGQQLNSTSTVDVLGNPLPTDFVLLFSERARGASVDIRVRGLLAGVDMFSASVTATAGTSEVTATVEFCGDSEINSARQEECDDANQNDTDDCLNSCQDAACGDGFVQSGVEECDDGNLANDDGCDLQCQREFVIQVATGGAHTCILLNNGKVRCWGVNSDGQLGYGNTENIGDDEFPNSVGNIDLGGLATEITAGAFHTCALLNDGNVKCWGGNDFGQLGYGFTQDIGDDESISAAGFVTIGGSATQISAGSLHTCALLVGGGLRCWGDGQFGKLGYGNEENIGDDELPNIAGDINIGTGVIQVSAGQRHTCALLSDNNIKCWGLGANGRLGYGNQTAIGDNELPDSVGTVFLGGQVERVFAASLNSCALLIGGTIRCWGGGTQGILGTGNTNTIGDDELPTTITPINLGATVAQMSLGSSSVCAITDNADVSCWGSGANGALGYGNTNTIGDDELPISVGFVNVGGVVQSVTSAGAHTCVVLIDGSVKCWGFGGGGRLGYGNTNNIGDDEIPASLDIVPIF